MKAPLNYFTGKTILLISPESWSHLFVSKHHYAITLAEQNNVYFLNPPSTGLSISPSAYKNLWIVNYTPFIKGLRFFPGFVQTFLMKRKFKRIERLASTQFDCIWSFDNSLFFNFSFLSKKILKISHIVDYSQNFQFLMASATADICFGVSQNIVDRLKKYNKNSFLIPHGISLSKNYFQKVVEIPGQNSVKAVYAGNLESKYIDKEILFSLVEIHQNVDFIFLGPGGLEWPRKPNTFYLGVIDRMQLPHFLERADVLLLLYDAEKYPEQLTNSHKVLEYLNSGKVIVGCLISDYANKPGLVEMSLKKSETLTLFNRVVTNLDYYNNNEAMTRRRDFAAANTYTERIKEIEVLIEQSGCGMK